MAMAVGAICWESSALESFSSQGPTIDFRVLKPDIAGQDRTSFFWHHVTRLGHRLLEWLSRVMLPPARRTSPEPQLWRQKRTRGSLQRRFRRSLKRRPSILGPDRQGQLVRLTGLWLGTAIPDPPTGATFVPLDPARLLDTRTGNGLAGGIYRRWCPGRSR